MGCGISHPGRLHPEPLSHHHPILVQPLPSAPPNRASSDSSLSTAADPFPPLPVISPPATSPSSPSSPATTSPSTSPTSPAPSSTPPSSHVPPSPRPLPSTRTLHPHDSISTRSPSSSVSPTTPRVLTSSGRVSLALPLSAFPMTDEAKVKIERQLRRHTKGGSSFGSVGSGGGGGGAEGASFSVSQPLRPSLSQAGQPQPPSPRQQLSPSHRPLRPSEFDMTDSAEASQAQAGEAATAGHSPRSTHSRRVPAAGGSPAEGVSAAARAVRMRRSMSHAQRVLDVDLVPDPMSGASTTASNSTDDSDTERVDMGRRPTSHQQHTLRSRQSAGARLLAPGEERRLHNLSVDSAAMSSAQQSASVSREANSSPRRRPRIHLRTTSRDFAPESTHTDPPPHPSGHADPVEEEVDRRVSVAASRKSSRRFTKTRHSSAFDADMDMRRSMGLTRYDSRGEPVDGSASISVAHSDGGDTAEEKAGDDEHARRDSPAQRLSPPAPAMSSSSTDDSISPIRLPRHQRAISSHPSPRSPGSDHLGPPPTPSYRGQAASLSLSLKGVHRASLARHTSRGKRLALLLSSSQLLHSLHSVALHKLGYAVVSAGGVQEAVDLACEQRVELLMMDWADGGEELVRGVREVEAERGDERTVIVAMVDEPMDEEAKARSRTLGCSAVVEAAAQVSAVLPEVIQRCQMGSQRNGSSSVPFVYVDARMEFHHHTM